MFRFSHNLFPSTYSVPRGVPVRVRQGNQVHRPGLQARRRFRARMQRGRGRPLRRVLPLQLHQVRVETR